jgi:hypothetical protein
MDPQINLEEIFPGITELIAEAERDFVTSSYPGRLLDADGLGIATVRVLASFGQGERISWLVYTDPEEPRRILARNPSVLEQWDRQAKHRYLVLDRYASPRAESRHFYIATGRRQS